MAKVLPPDTALDSVNKQGDPALELPAINARADAPTPDNTPVPGGGRWAWNYSLACWADLDVPATPATNLIQPE